MASQRLGFFGRMPAYIELRVLFCGQPVHCVRADLDAQLVEVYVTDTQGQRIQYPDGSFATAELRGPVSLEPVGDYPP